MAAITKKKALALGKGFLKLFPSFGGRGIKGEVIYSPGYFSARKAL
jgi:hypothetical protein